MFVFADPAMGDELPSRIWSVNADSEGNIYVLGRISDGMGGLVGHIVKLQPAVTGDFNGDDLFDCLDVDALVAEIAVSGADLAFDITNDGIVDEADLAQWLIASGANNADQTGGNPYLLGDANLDGTVDGQDFLVWNSNKFSAAAAWCSGDFNADGTVDGGDFIVWNKNKFMSSDCRRSGAPVLVFSSAWLHPATPKASLRTS